MPASRIAFALADFVSEIRRLLPKDETLRMTVRLAPDAFDVVVRELSEYGGVERQIPGGGAGEWAKFGGIVFERMTATDA